MKKRGIESSAEWAAVASHENAHARGFLEERDAHMSGLATYLGVTGNLGITADDNLVTEMLFGAIMNDNSANEDGVYHWTLMADGSLRMDEDGYLRDENGFYINSDGTRTSKRTDNTIGSKGQETGLLKILGLEDTPENRETVRNLLIENGFTHTIDPDDPDNVDEWYWDRTGPSIKHGDGYITLDVDQRNRHKSISSEDIWSQFSDSVPAAVFAANYEATVDSMIADLLGIDIGPVQTQKAYSNRFGKLGSAKIQFYLSIVSPVDLDDDFYNIGAFKSIVEDPKTGELFYSYWDYKHFGLDLTRIGGSEGKTVKAGISGKVMYKNRNFNSNGNNITTQIGFSFKEGETETWIGTGLFSDYYHLLELLHLM